MELDHQFEVAAPMAETWPAFLDMPRLAPCMPGAEVTEVIDDRNVKGGAKVKVGPVNLRFAGQAEMVEIDEDARSATMVAKGSDAKGRGNAEAEVRFALNQAGPATTAVDVHTTLNLTGSVAQYGRASGLIDEIANQLIAQFVDNLEAELATEAPELTQDSSVQESHVQKDHVQKNPAQDKSHVASNAVSQPPPEVANKPDQAVSGLSLLFKAILAAVKKLFAR